MAIPGRFAQALLISAALFGSASIAGCAASGANPRQRAAMLADKGRYTEAAAVLRKHLEAEPADIEARRLLVRMLGLGGDLGAAEREADRLAKQLGAGSPVPWIELGHAYELAHRYEQALALYDRASAAAPRDAAGPREGGLRAARWGEAELAEPRLSEALRRDPGDAKVWHALGLVRLKLKDVEGAELAYRSGLRADPAALENRVGLATVALLVGDPSAALAEYDAIIAARPRFGDAYLGRAWALLELGRLEEAERALDEGARLGADRRVVARQKALLGELRRGSEPHRNR